MTEHMQSTSFSGRRHSPAAAAVIDDRSSQVALRAAMAAAAVLLVAGGIFAVTRPVQATIGDIFILGIAWVFQVFTGWLGNLLIIVIGALTYIATYNGFVTSSPVANGWSIVRDVTNMFFILVLLVIAFGTILGIDAYSYKNKMLSRLLIMAVVVNFSRTICGLLIDFAQVVMLTFVYGFREAAAGNFADALRITQVMQAREISDNDAGVTAFSIAIASILAFFLILIALVVVILMTITLAIRIVYLWLLVVMSPLAFFLKAVPGGSASGYYGMWWKMFTGQVVVGPVMAFFLWLSLVSVASGNLSTAGFTGQSATGEEISGPITEGFRGTEIQTFIISICLLMGGLQLSKQISSESAGAAPGMAKKALSVGKRAVQGAYKSSPSLQRGVDATLSRATKMGVPLAKDALVATRKSREADLKKSQADLKYLRPDEHGARAKKLIPGVYGSTGGMVDQKEALREKLKHDAEKGPPKDASAADVQKFKDQHFKQKGQFKALGGQLMDATVDKDLADMEKKRPSLIINDRLKDSKKPEEQDEYARQQKKFRDVARGVNASKINEMSADELDNRFLAFANPKAILEAGKNATGEQYDRLKPMGDSEEAIRDKQRQLRLDPQNFGIMSENERRDMLREFSGTQPMTASQQGFVDNMAAKAGLGDIKDAQGNFTDLGKQIAAGISNDGLKNLPADIRSALSPLVEPGRALRAGTPVQDVMAKNYDSVNGNLDAAGKDKFTQILQTTPGAAAAVDLGALQKNGGMNDVSIAVANNIGGAEINAMVDGGKTDQAGALADIADKLSKMSTLKDEDIKEIISSSGMSSTLDEVKKSIENSAKVLDEVKSQSSPMNAEMRQQQIVNKISANEERSASRLEGVERRITGKKRSRPKG